MEYRYGSHTVFQIEYHFVWVTKYRYKVLHDEVALQVKELVRLPLGPAGLYHGHREVCGIFGGPSDQAGAEAEKPSAASENPSVILGTIWFSRYRS